MKITLSIPDGIAARLQALSEARCIGLQETIRNLLADRLEARGWSFPDPSEPSDRLLLEHTRAGRSIPGFVYLMAMLPEDGTPATLFKIGFSVNPLRRLEEVCKAEDAPVELVCSIPAADMRALERDLHQQFRDCRVRGEWFRLNEYQVATLQALARVES